MAGLSNFTSDNLTLDDHPIEGGGEGNQVSRHDLRPEAGDDGLRYSQELDLCCTLLDAQIAVPVGRERQAQIDQRLLGIDSPDTGDLFFGFCFADASSRNPAANVLEPVPT